MGPQRTTAQVDPRTSSLLEDHDRLEPVAIVGFSLKFPQDATSADGFWKIMMEGRCTATEFPSERLSVTAMHHPDPKRRDTVSTSHVHSSGSCIYFLQASVLIHGRYLFVVGIF